MGIEGYDSDSDNSSKSSISSSSSSSSDDDFLPSKTNPDGSKITEEEREAIIRKKLLENFYGKSHAIVNQQEQEEKRKKQQQLERAKLANKEENKESTIVPSKVTGIILDNLDSDEFDAYNHTLKHLRSSNVERLLSVDEKLALDIRTLNSTMQTLVYENYSKFIDATDAVRSIGQSVDSSEDGLKRLNEGMRNMEHLANKLDKALATSREAVAEKVRVKRHLTKLDSLLKLPDTLNALINEGKYRLACKTHENAAGVLSKHSAGFESLARIESVCKDIISEMYDDLYRKLEHWSSSDDAYYNSDVMRNSLGGDDVWDVAKPKSIADILECGGTVSILSKSNYFTDLNSMPEEDCQSKTTNSCANFLVNVLKEHHDTQEGSVVIPTVVLDGILETCTLFSVTFRNDQNWLLGDFVSHVFASFLAHVRTSLLELILQENSNDVDPITEISAALSSLLRSVRELASGLALPEVGVDMRIASSLVDQTVEVTESMIRRYVSLRFESLKLTCVKDCLKPFLNDVLQEDEEKSNENTDQKPKKGHAAEAVDVVRMATVVLEDIMQLTEENIETMAAAMISSVPVESTMVQIVIVKNAHSYAAWLASTLETLAGCNVLKANDIYVDVVDALNDDDGSDRDSEDEDEDQEMKDVILQAEDEMSEISYSDETDSALYTEIFNLVQNIDNASTSKVARYLILALAELCRLAQKSIVETIDRAIAIPFASDDSHHPTPDKNNDSSTNQSSITTKKRFQLAACRVLALYATDQGCDAAKLTSCYDLVSTSMDIEDIRHVPDKPRDCICQILKIIKSTSLDFSHVFGGERQAGPVPTFHDGKCRKCIFEYVKAVEF